MSIKSSVAMTVAEVKTPEFQSGLQKSATQHLRKVYSGVVEVVCVYARLIISRIEASQTNWKLTTMLIKGPCDPQISSQQPTESEVRKFNLLLHN